MVTADTCVVPLFFSWWHWIGKTKDGHVANVNFTWRLVSTDEQFYFY